MPVTIHVIGDSHASVFTGLHGLCRPHPHSHVQALPGFRVWHLGPFLAHSLATRGHRVHAAARVVMKQIGERDRVVFFFGEIDCRAHIVKRAANDPEIEGIASRVAHAYARAARGLVGSRKLCLIALPPPTVAQHGNTVQPTVGTFAQRLRAVRAFNSTLHVEAAALKARVLDAHQALADRRGAPNTAYFADGVHADARALPLLLNRFRRLGWLSAKHASLGAAAALSRVPPPGGSRVVFPGLLDDAEQARSMLIERAALRCKAAGARTIAIMGAGRHTRSMGLTPFRSQGLRVAAILDDAATSRGGRSIKIDGVPVLRPGALRARVDAVVVSSDAHEEALLESARLAFDQSRVMIVPIYR